jgi:hypothetical protein
MHICADEITAFLLAIPVLCVLGTRLRAAYARVKAYLAARKAAS